MSALRRVLVVLARASAALRRALTMALLAVVYVIVLPWFAVAKALAPRRARGWRLRDDPSVAARERLRRLF